MTSDVRDPEPENFDPHPLDPLDPDSARVCPMPFFTQRGAARDAKEFRTRGYDWVVWRRPC